MRFFFKESKFNNCNPILNEKNRNKYNKWIEKKMQRNLEKKMRWNEKKKR